MLRLIIPALVLSGTCLAQDSAEFLAKLEPAANPFAPAVAVFDSSGISGVYSTLSKLSGTVFENDGAGTIIFDGQPWKTGETRNVPVTGGSIPTIFVSLQPAEDEHPATAVFRLTNNQQEITVDVAGFSALKIDSEPATWGWQVSKSTMVAVGSHEGVLEVRSKNRRIGAKPTAFSTRFNLTMCTTPDDSRDSWLAAPESYRGDVIVMSPNIKSLKVPFNVLNQPATELVLGAIVVTPQGALVGVLGSAGLVSAKELGASDTTGSIPGDVMERLLFVRGR